MGTRISLAACILLAGLANGQTGDSLGTEPIADLTRTEFVQPNLGAKLDRILDDYSASGFSGTVIIGWGGLVALHKAYGFADREQEIENEINTAFPIGTLTMQFTAVGILQLVDRGLLELDTPIEEILGPLPGEKGEATVEHLLTHVGGLVADEGSLPSGDRETILRMVREAPIDFRPGTSHRVSRIGYTLLAMIIESVTGSSYEAYIREQIFERSNMETARFLDDPPVDGSPIAVGYQGGRSALGIIGKLPLPRHGIGLVGAHLRNRARDLTPAPTPNYDWSIRGVEGIVATVGDLFRWELALRGDRLLSDASKERLLRPTDRKEAHGWRIEKTKRGTDRYHKGSASYGYATEYLRYNRFLRYVDKDLVVIIAINSDMGWSKPVWKSIEDLTYGEDYSTPFTILAVLIILIVIGSATRRSKHKPLRPRRRRGSLFADREQPTRSSRPYLRRRRWRR
jgi:CubicO group peptidase (beta-lactamase class C family)